MEKSSSDKGAEPGGKQKIHYWCRKVFAYPSPAKDLYYGF